MADLSDFIEQRTDYPYALIESNLDRLGLRKSCLGQANRFVSQRRRFKSSSIQIPHTPQHSGRSHPGVLAADMSAQHNVARNAVTSG